ncbi:MAG: ubiquinol-cytochrome c reductase iron-sulfur subunit [bacterium]
MSDISREPPSPPNLSHSQKGRRDFLYYATAGAAVVTVGAGIWPLINSMNPSADVTAVAKIEVDLSNVALGARITVVWQGKPIFIDHRTEKRISESRADDQSPMPDPAFDSARAQRSEWLIQIGICTHLGCIPLGQNPGDPVGQWDGWLCPCHGSVYDTAGRIRRGPAPRNLDLPPYHFVSNTLLRIG